MIAASGPPARQPLLGDGNHLIESLLGPRCERFVTCSRRAPKVFPLRRDEIVKEKSHFTKRTRRWSVDTRRTLDSSEYFSPANILFWIFRATTRMIRNESERNCSIAERVSKELR